MTENESTEAIFKFDEITKKYEKKKKPVIEAAVPSTPNSEAIVTNASGTELTSPKAIQNNPPNSSAIMS